MSWQTHVDNINAAMINAFAETVTLDGNVIQAVVDLRSGGRDIGGGMLIDKIDPSIEVLTTDLADLIIGKNSIALIRGNEYRIVSTLPDDNGMTTLTVRPV